MQMWPSRQSSLAVRSGSGVSWALRSASRTSRVGVVIAVGSGCNDVKIDQVGRLLQDQDRGFGKRKKMGLGFSLTGGVKTVERHGARERPTPWRDWASCRLVPRPQSWRRSRSGSWLQRGGSRAPGVSKNGEASSVRWSAGSVVEALRSDRALRGQQLHAKAASTSTSFHRGIARRTWREVERCGEEDGLWRRLGKEMPKARSV